MKILRMISLLGCFVLLMISLLVLLFIGCVSYTMVYDTEYDISLQAVEKPNKYGESVITPISEEQSSFEDNVVKIIWMPKTMTLDFTLENKTDHTIKIIWNEAAFVNVKNASGNICDYDRLPSIIVKHTTVTYSIKPDNIILFPDKRIVPPEKNVTDELVEKEAKAYVGKGYQLLLPLQIKENTDEYLFYFQVNDVRIQKHRL